MGDLILLWLIGLVITAVAGGFLAAILKSVLPDDLEDDAIHALWVLPVVYLMLTLLGISAGLFYLAHSF